MCSFLLIEYHNGFLFAYIGFDQISTSAEEARNPASDLPIGIFLSLLICTILYILVTASFTSCTVGVVVACNRKWSMGKLSRLKKALRHQQK